MFIVNANNFKTFYLASQIDYNNNIQHTCHEIIHRSENLNIAKVKKNCKGLKGDTQRFFTKLMKKYFLTAI